MFNTAHCVSILPQAFFSLIRWTTGDFFFVPYTKLQTSNATVAPLFVAFFLLMVVLTSINMLVAILLDFYAMVKKEREARPEQNLVPWSTLLYE